MSQFTGHVAAIVQRWWRLPNSTCSESNDVRDRYTAVAGARGSVSVLLSVTVTRDPPLIRQIGPDCWGIMRVAGALSRGLCVWKMVTDLACAETVHHVFDPGCLPRLLLWPSHSLSANRSVWHPSCVVNVRVQLYVWLADGRLRRFACRAALVLRRTLCSFGALV